MKVELSAKFLLVKMNFIYMQTKLIFIWKALHLACFHNEVHSNSEITYSMVSKMIYTRLQVEIPLMTV